MADEAVRNPPPAPAPDSEEAVAAAAAAAEQAAKVAEAERVAREQELNYRADLEAWERDTAAARNAERERLLTEMVRRLCTPPCSQPLFLTHHVPYRSQRARRAERATERAGIEERLKSLQAQNVTLMRQLKLVLSHEETQKRKRATEVRVVLPWCLCVSATRD